GAFSDRANAEERVQQIEKLGIDAFIDVV
ncbi:MAG TPA: N-acetylmuramoyl-L-alanine amidase, partial [Bacillus bacterium]|nr:N-acetylmuramoyl-L-alanine amidase [Bacillus sp. (in: firmicutes)]